MKMYMNMAFNQTGKKTLKSWAAVIGITLVVFVGLTIIFSSWYTIDQSERGVVLRTGAIIGEAEPGWHFKTPIIEDVAKISLQTQKVVYEKVPAYSQDQQPADIKISINYRVDPSKVSALYTEYRREENMVDRVITPLMAKQLKAVFGQYSAYRSITERSKFNNDVEKVIKEDVAGKPVIIESVQIENIDFSDAYEGSIEQRMLAEVEVQKLEQNAQREKIQAAIVETQAEGKAKAIEATARAEALAITVKGEAEAAAIRAKGTALASNPALVHLIQAERWNGTLPVTMVPGGAVPMIDLRK